ncbi:pectinesterase family protein [Pedobacter rhizosphaerae]|uniref:Pectinesterase n=1 Tax=Pedobacter rhizosphaerae TaxID=390241 RepID=A0A1H9PQ82_9SPHI|nr:pectinesterase family protein [Pedobacter rhizosphaerae]SER50250.1 pectinesterase [Pedobacter rhizosphaerae]
MTKTNIFFAIKLLTLFFFTEVRSQQPNIQFSVSQDGTGDYRTIQEAVNAVRDHMQYKVSIYVKPGIYKEKLVIPAWKKNIRIIGVDREKTIITNGDYTGKPFPGGDFTGNPKFGTYTSYTVLVQGNDCSLENITVENTAGPVGQAVALTIEGDRFAAKNCALLGHQDTLYTSKDGRCYFENCLIVGTTDFIFGEATAVFYKCKIKSLADSFITAASTSKQQVFGYVFLDCDLVAAPGVKKVFLGRPWRPFAKTVFIRCNLGEQIVREGWHSWPGDPLFANKDKTAFYAEYNNKGKGADTSGRVAWAKQLTKKEAEAYTVKNIFLNWDPTF